MSKAPAAVKRQVAIGKAYQDLFSSPVGRIVLVDLMKKAKFLEIGEDDGPFANGRRSIVADILSTTRYDYNKLLALAEERVEEISDEA